MRGSKALKNPIFISEQYLKLARDRKKILDFAKYLTTEMRKLHPFEMERVIKEMMHNSALSGTDRNILSERIKELKEECNEKERKYRRMGCHEPLVDGEDGKGTDGAA